MNTKFKWAPENFEQMSTVVITEAGNKYIFFPYWLQADGDDHYIAHSLGNLPDELRDHLNKERNQEKVVPEFTVAQTKAFIDKGYQSVSARHVASLYKQMKHMEDTFKLHIEKLQNDKP